MTEKPTTLEAALEWLVRFDGELMAWDGYVRVGRQDVGIEGNWVSVLDKNGNIPAAIVEAVQQVWDQVNQPAA